MSAGRSSQLAACFSVERTKYLMLSKSMSARSAPQVGSAGDVRVRPAELVPGQLLDLLVLGQYRTVRIRGHGRGHINVLPAKRGVERATGVVLVAAAGGLAVGAAAGTEVVHTSSPRASVARRCTWVPSSCSKARVSASQSCGNSVATCATGQ